MAFKPKEQPRSGNSGPVVQREYPTPKAGSRPARISLIVDMGIQEREDFEDPKTKEKRPQEPCQQVAVFADLTRDRVNYGEGIGEQYYRIPINDVFKGEVRGINFITVPQKDGDGNILKDADGKWLPTVLHPNSKLTRLAKAIEKPEIVFSHDIDQLLNGAFMATVEVKVTESKDKVDEKTGQPIIYKNVNFKGQAPVPEGYEIPELETPAMSIQFDTATKDQIKYIRAGLLKQIKLAKNYAGSKMQKAIEAYEAEKAENAQASSKSKTDEDKAAAKKAKEKAEKQNDFDDDGDVPF